MNALETAIARVCLGAAACGAIIGLSLIAISTAITPAFLETVRSQALFWLASYLMAIGSTYVFVANRAPVQARLSGLKVNVFAGLPPTVRPLLIGVFAASVVAFFGIGALIEGRFVEQGAGETALLGSGFMCVCSGVASGAWSALRASPKNDV